MFKTQPRELASSTGWVSSSLGIKGHVLRNLSGSLYEHEIAAVQLITGMKLLNSALSLYEHEIAAVKPITDMKTFKKCTENYMFKSVRVSLTTLSTHHYHSISLFLSHEEEWSFVTSAPVSWWLIVVRLQMNLIQPLFYFQGNHGLMILQFLKWCFEINFQLK